MDTRSKIIDAGRLAALRQPYTLVSGAFDVLTADHVRRLREFGRPLVVAIVDPPGALLERRARAELAAALEMVDYVVETGVNGALVLDEDRAALIEHVIERHSR